MTGSEKIVDDWARDLSRGAGPLIEQPAPAGLPHVHVDQVLRRRAAAMHLASALPAGSLAQAAWGGLQDSAPRSAQLSLHARVEGVVPGDWERPELVQVWLRGADYVVPEDAFEVFTLGRMPRDPEQAMALDRFGAAILAALDGRSRRDVLSGIESRLSPGEAALLRSRPFLVRALNVTGHFRIRWDARFTEVVPAMMPRRSDPEPARLELLRRFLHWLGPARLPQFTRWAGLGRRDSEDTWDRLREEMTPISLDGRQRWLLRADVESLQAEPVAGVRLLPPGDPYLWNDRDLLPAEPKSQPTRDGAGRELSTRIVNSLTGRVLVDGRLAGAWGRVQNRLRVALWPGEDALWERVEAESQRMAGAIGKPMRIDRLY